MSHLPERKENTCLNCNAVLHGRFCHVCGQQNIEPREGFWNMLTHFVFDLFHFDGKFFSTIKYLLFKPGYLSQEHLRGRRADYLHPIRMYIFTSAFFFLLFFSLNKNVEESIELNKVSSKARNIQLAKLQSLKQKYTHQIDSVRTVKAKDSLKQLLFQVNSDVELVQTDSLKAHSLKSLGDTANTSNFINIISDKIVYKSSAEYLNYQKSLPKLKRDNFFVKRVRLQQIHLNNDYESQQEALIAIFKNFIYNFPKLLFVSLPLFAFVLYLINIRKKKYFFSDHLVFSLHLYCAFFIIILIALVFNESVVLLNIGKVDANGKAAGIGSWFSGLTFLILFFYWYKSIRRFYEQSRRKTILKFFLLLFINFFLFGMLFVGFLFLSALTS